MKKLILAMPIMNKGFLFNLNRDEWFMGVCVKNKEFIGEAIAISLSSPIRNYKHIDEFTYYCLESKLSG